MEFFEISALSGNHVHALFNQLAQKLTGLEVNLVRDTGNAPIAATNAEGATDMQQDQVEEKKEAFKLGSKATVTGT